MRSASALCLLLMIAAPAASLALDAPETPIAGPAFASPGAATIRPGTEMYTGGAQCTSNFVFHDDADVYIGYAAHCAGTGGSTSTNGCLTGSQPLGTAVTINGAHYPGELAYSSWLAMQAAGANPNSEMCQYNDFALVRLDPRDVGRTSPSVLHYGGPTALCANPGSFEQVISYGNSGLRFGLDPVAPKTGYVLSTTSQGWSSTVYMASPGVPGDSGSGYMDMDHCAWGVTSTLALAPYAASNGISSLDLGLGYAASQGFAVQLATAPAITTIPV